MKVLSFISYPELNLTAHNYPVLGYTNMTRLSLRNFWIYERTAVGNTSRIFHADVLTKSLHGRAKHISWLRNKPLDDYMVEK